MLKICDDTICKPLEMIIKGLSLFRFHLNGKKDTVPIHKPPPPPPQPRKSKKLSSSLPAPYSWEEFRKTYFQQNVYISRNLFSTTCLDFF